MNDSAWDRLGTTYAKRGLVLALGSGVSRGCGLPTWPDLLERLADELWGDGGHGLVRDLRGKGYTLPSIASVLEASCPSPADFTERVWRNLYKDFRHGEHRFFVEERRHYDRGRFVEFVQQRNATLRAVAAMCAVREGGRYSRNRLVRAIINFNFDSTLRAYSFDRYRRRLLRSVERPSATSSHRRINVYYMHGFLRFDKALSRLRHHAPDYRVFTEQEYFDFFDRPNSLFNYTFLHFLREECVLFVGLSLQDDNIRRLLHYSRVERKRGFEAEGIASEEADRRSLRHFAILPSSGDPRIDEKAESSLRRLGVSAAWVGDFPDIPDGLASLYRAGGGHWEDVF